IKFNVAIAIWMFLKVILVLFFCQIVMFKRFDFSDDRVVIALFFCSDYFIDDSTVGFIFIINAGPVLLTAVISLLVQQLRIDNHEVMAKQLLQVHTFGIVSDM